MKNDVFRIWRIKRTGYMLMLVGIMGVGLAACDTGTPASPTATPPAVQATSTPGTGRSEVSPTAGAQSTVVGESTPVAQSTPSAAGTVQAGVCAKLNLNTLTEEELTSTIPNFSSRMVREFFEYRPYASIREFRQEIGKYVDASQVAEYEQYVYVPVDPNTSDTETLKQLPGVDDAVVADLVNARPYASSEAFLTALGGKVSTEQLAGATCYLAASR